MANTSSSGAAAPAKEPGRIRQIWQVLRMTTRHDRPSLWIFLAAFLLPVIAAIVLCAFLYGGNVLMWILMLVIGILVGLLLFMFALNWRAEKVAYSQIEGRTGAAGQVLGSSMRGTWITSDMPVAFNPKTQDCVYRAIGKPGIVLVTEGQQGAPLKKLLDDERRKAQRVAPNVPIHTVHVGTREGDAKLLGLKKHLNGLASKVAKNELLTKSEIQAVANRLASLRSTSMPIPKGVDPMRMRPSRKGPR